MENAINCPMDLSALPADDPEMFRRVWDRVMPESGEGVPITVEGVLQGGDLPCSCPRSAREDDTAAPSAPAGLGAAPCPHRGSDFPDAGDIPRLGPASAGYGGRLQRQITDALECWQLYRQLARRSAAQGGRVLAAMAGEKFHSARRLAAAYFLISGVRFWPADRVPAPAAPSYLGAIRRAYQTEQQRGQAYLLSAADTGDTALAELYQELAAQCAEHEELLRALLEQNGF